MKRKIEAWKRWVEDSYLLTMNQVTDMFIIEWMSVCKLLIFICDMEYFWRQTLITDYTIRFYFDIKYYDNIHIHTLMLINIYKKVNAKKGKQFYLLFDMTFLFDCLAIILFYSNKYIVRVNKILKASLKL